MNSKYDYIFDKNNCPYKDVCSLVSDENHCNSSCLRFMEIDYLLYMSRLPKSKMKALTLVPEVEDLDSFKRLKEIKDNIVEFVKFGNSLYLFSLNTGNGKTCWAIKLLLKYFDEVWCGNGFKPRGLFINVPNFLRMVTENVTNPNEDFIELKRLIASVDLVIWDDIGATKLSDYDHKNLLSFIDQRVLGEKSNIYTGNLPGECLPDALGQRLASRVFNESSVIELLGQDRRGMIL